MNEKQFNFFTKEYKNLQNRSFSDDVYFQKLVDVIFYSGFKAKLVSDRISIIHKYFSNIEETSLYDENKIQEIMQDDKMIKNKIKINSCVKNARAMKNIINKHKSFENYLNSFDSIEDLRLDLIKKFKYLGEITSYHFLMDIGKEVLKPDRVVMRIFKRLGFLDNVEEYERAIEIGQELSKETELPIRYIDIIFVSYGQEDGDDEFGLEDGICLEQKPKCNFCLAKADCNYS